MSRKSEKTSWRDQKNHNVSQFTDLREVAQLICSLCPLSLTSPISSTSTCVCVCVPSRFSHFWLSVTPWSVSHQPPLSMGCSRQEYWSGSLFSSPGDLSDPRTELKPLELQVDRLLSVPPEKPLFGTREIDAKYLLIHSLDLQNSLMRYVLLLSPHLWNEKTETQVCHWANTAGNWH